jgi:hypothetical protein
MACGRNCVDCFMNQPMLLDLQLIQTALWTFPTEAEASIRAEASIGMVVGRILSPHKEKVYTIHSTD